MNIEKIVELIKQKLITNKMVKHEHKLSKEAEQIRKYIRAHDFDQFHIGVGWNDNKRTT